MSFSVCIGRFYLAPFLPVSLCLQARLVLVNSGAHLVVSGPGWNSVLSSKAQACFMGKLQTLAPTALEFISSALSC